MASRFEAKEGHGCDQNLNGGDFMMSKLFVSATIAGLVGAYLAMLYAIIHIIVLVDASYFQSLAM